MRKFIPRINQKGFTLIELMIVVGIIGILVSIAAPNFSRYQSKARQSEAKIALAAVYGSEKGFFSEYASYIGAMDAIGYAPEGHRRFYGVGWTSAHTTSPTGYNGTFATPSFAAVNNSYGSCTGSAALSTATTGDNQAFTTTAVGCIRQGAAHDTWTMTDIKVLTNSPIGL